MRDDDRVVEVRDADRAPVLRPGGVHDATFQPRRSPQGHRVEPAHPFVGGMHGEGPVVVVDHQGRAEPVLGAGEEVRRPPHLAALAACVVIAHRRRGELVAERLDAPRLADLASTARSATSRPNSNNASRIAMLIASPVGVVERVRGGGEAERGDRGRRERRRVEAVEQVGRDRLA